MSEAGAIPRAGLRSWLDDDSLRVALLLVLISLTLTASGSLVRVDHLLFDVGQGIKRRAAPADLLIVAIDEDSLDRLGRWPWPRGRHARVLQSLCAARPAAIAFDVAFSEKSSDPLADAALAEAVAACGNVVLPLVIEATRVGGQLLESPPIAPLAAAAAGIGRIGVHLDEDGIARAVHLREGVGTPAWPLFAEETLRVAQQLPARYATLDSPAPNRREPREASQAERAGAGQAERPEASQPERPDASQPERPDASQPERPDASQHLLRENPRRFEFVGPPGSIARLSYADVLAGRIAREAIAGRIVLVGATAVGLGDFLPTPVSALGQPMPGVEVQANVLQSMKSERLIEPLPLLPTLLLAALLAAMPMLWLPRLMPLPGLLASTAWVLALGLACALLPGLTQRWFESSGALAAALFALPLWSWRRLEAARRHLDQELRRLRTIVPDSQFGAALGHAIPGELGRLGFEQRIAWVQAAQRALQALESERGEALAFISHDLRVPLAGAVRALEGQGECDRQRLLPPLRRALSMAQAFLWLARAQALDALTLAELDLEALLHQAADEMYALARERDLQIVRELPAQPVWVRGDFEALERCAINLLDNAISYAPAGTPVRIGLELPRDGQVEWWVDNEGEALPAAQRERLFQRFSRSAAGDLRASSMTAIGSASASSTGLGLYYVRTVAERHGGTVGVECAAGRVRFWLRLPGGEIGLPDDASSALVPLPTPTTSSLAPADAGARLG